MIRDLHDLCASGAKLATIRCLQRTTSVLRCARETAKPFVSPGEFGALLLLGFQFRLGSGRELQHGCGLAFFEMGEKDLLAVRHFQDIVMHARRVLVPLPEDRGGEGFDALGLVGGPAELERLIEGKLGAGQDTNRRGIADRIVNGFESDRATSEIVAYQFVGDDCGTRLGMLQAEVAHDQTFPGLVAATSQSPLRRRQRIASARSILLIRGIRGRRRDHIFGGVDKRTHGGDGILAFANRHSGARQGGVARHCEHSEARRSGLLRRSRSSQ